MILFQCPLILLPFMLCVCLVPSSPLRRCCFTAHSLFSSLPPKKKKILPSVHHPCRRLRTTTETRGDGDGGQLGHVKSGERAIHEGAASVCDVLLIGGGALHRLDKGADVGHAGGGLDLEHVRLLGADKKLHGGGGRETKRRLWLGAAGTKSKRGEEGQERK